MYVDVHYFVLFLLTSYRVGKGAGDLRLRDSTENDV